METPTTRRPEPPADGDAVGRPNEVAFGVWADRRGMARFWPECVGL